MDGSHGSARARETLRVLRAKITSGEWPMNERIPSEQELTEMLGVGRTTVREAVRSLATLGMLETIAGIGTFVRSRTPVSTLLVGLLGEFELADVLEYRRALEVEAARSAASRRTDEQLQALHAALVHHGTAWEQRPRYLRTPGDFHAVVFASAHNALLSSLYAGVLGVLREGVSSGEAMATGDDTTREDGHRAVYEAIAAGDAEAAARAMAEHAGCSIVATARRGA